MSLSSYSSLSSPRPRQLALSPSSCRGSLRTIHMLCNIAVATDETIDRYKRRIDELIPNMIMSSDTLFCNKVLCECGNHRSDIDDVCKQLIDVLLRAGRETLPQCNHKDRGIPYWNDEVESVRETAIHFISFITKSVQ